MGTTACCPHTRTKQKYWHTVSKHCIDCCRLTKNLLLEVSGKLPQAPPTTTSTPMATPYLHITDCKNARVHSHTNLATELQSITLCQPDSIIVWSRARFFFFQRISSFFLLVSLSPFPVFLSYLCMFCTLMLSQYKACQLVLRLNQCLS